MSVQRPNKILYLTETKDIPLNNLKRTRCIFSIFESLVHDPEILTPLLQLICDIKSRIIDACGVIL